MKTKLTPHVRRYLQRRFKMASGMKKRRKNAHWLSRDQPFFIEDVDIVEPQKKRLRRNDDDEVYVETPKLVNNRNRKRSSVTSNIIQSSTTMAYKKMKAKPTLDESVVCLFDKNKNAFQDSVIIINDVDDTKSLSNSNESVVNRKIPRKSNTRKWNETIEEPTVSSSGKTKINKTKVSTNQTQKPIDESVIIIEDSVKEPLSTDELSIVWSNCDDNTSSKTSKVNDNSTKKDSKLFFVDRRPNLNYLSLIQTKKNNKTPKKKKEQNTDDKNDSISSTQDSEKAGKLREIIVDGCNVATAYNPSQGFNEKGIQLVVEYFQKRGHQVTVFVPQHKRSKNRLLLEQYHKEGIVVFTAHRKVGGKSISSYDDRYILEYATIKEGIVISLDQFRDLYDEKPEWRHTITNRILQPTFVGDIVMFPHDPLGRKGPTLDKFLKHDEV